MKLIRTFHNVGHGAFYTERFYNEDNNAIFTAVYDCGAFKLNSLENIIRNYFREGDTIDFLFISHFHSDHINGFNCLNQWCNIRHIVLPALSNAMAIESYVYNYFENENADCEANRFIETSYNAYQQLLGGNNNNPNTSPFVFIKESLEEQALDENNLIREEQLYGILGNNAITIQIENVNWVYIPFNTHHICFDNINRATILEVIRDIGKEIHIPTDEELMPNGTINFNVLSHFLEQYKTNPNIENRELSINDIKKVYDEIFKKRHNSYSMPVYSGYKDINLIKNYKSSDNAKIDIAKRNIDLNSEYSACLYTGDFECTTDNKFWALCNYYNARMLTLNTIQVPHHGSFNNHKAELYQDSAYNIISVHSHKYGLPSADVMKDIMSYGGLPIIITNDINCKTIFNINNL